LPSDGNPPEAAALSRSFSQGRPLRGHLRASPEGPPRRRGPFDDIASAEASDDREKLFEKLKEEFLRHKEAEERTFYAALSMIPDLADRIEEAMEEHVDAEELFEEIDGLDAEEEEWIATVVELKEEIEHHVAEEEGEIFVQAREHLTDEQAKKLGKEFESEKKRLDV